MAYTINKTDGTVVATVEDGTLNTSTSISLVGQNYQGYGEAIGENFITLLENSANTSAPTNPITGELWYDKTNNSLKVYDGVYFEYINTVRPSSSQPTQSLRTGVLWYDTSNSLLKLYNGTSFVTVGPVTVLDEDNMASNSATAVASQQSVKKYVDDQIVASNTLPVVGDDSTTIEVPFTTGLTVRGGTNISTTTDIDSSAELITAYRLTVNLDSNITVNQIGAADSSSVSITSPLQVTGSLQTTGAFKTGTSLQIAGTTAVTSILDEDAMGSNSATALATQQSIKAYVDSAVSGLTTTFSFSDSASNTGSITLGTTDMEFRSGDSITTTVAGTGVTFDLNETISVDQINAGDSSVITMGAPIRVLSDSGITLGADDDVSLTQSGANFTLKNKTEDGNILINVNDGGVDSTAVTVNGSTKAVTFAGNCTVQGDLNVTGTTFTNNSETLTITDPLIVLNQGASIIQGYDAGIIVDRGVGDSANQQNAALLWDESANTFAFVFTPEDGTTAGNVAISQYAELRVSELTGKASSATYADLAERYEADVPMDIGDCVKIGGSKEITKTDKEYDTDVFGVIAENPAFKMNADAGTDDSHPYVTLTGRTVCKVQGPIAKGDRIVTSDVPGVAKKCDLNDPKFHTLTIIGRSLGSHATTAVAMIEVVLGRN
jgi:hypothetical protein